MNYLNPSRIALGALLAIFMILYGPPNAAADIKGLDQLGLLFLVVLTIAFFVGTSSLELSAIANVGFGSCLMILGVQNKQVQELFVHGQIWFVIIILILAAIYLNRIRNIAI